jgi:hypothetical protein
MKTTIRIFSAIFSQFLGGLCNTAVLMDEQLLIVDNKRSFVETLQMGNVKLWRRNFNGLYIRQKLIYVLCLSLTWFIGLI